MIRERGRALLKRSLANAADLLIDAACVRYFHEVGQHQVCADETFTNLDRLVTCPHLEGKRLADITDKVVTDVIAWRRGHHRWGRADLDRISPATVNRSRTEVLQNLFTHAKKKWGASFDHEPNWAEHMLKQSGERVRELRTGEADALELAQRTDYAPFLDFVRASGQRGYKECLIRWTNVDWHTRLIATIGKHGRTVTMSITEEIEAILLRCGEGKGGAFVPHHPEWVHAYVCQRADKRKGLEKGERYPVTKEGAKTMWRRTCKRAGIVDFRLHDFRHDLATKLLRKTGNLKLVHKRR
jgi:integrase